MPNLSSIIHFSLHNAIYCYRGLGLPQDPSSTPNLWFVTCEKCLQEVETDLREARRGVIAEQVTQVLLQEAITSSIRVATTEAEVDSLISRAELILIADLLPAPLKVAQQLKAELKRRLGLPSAPSTQGTP